MDASMPAPVFVTVVLRPRVDLGPAIDLDRLGSQPPSGRRHLSRPELAVARGARPDDVRTVLAHADRRGLTVGAVTPGRRTIQLSGERARVADALVTDPPADVRAAVVAVLGLDPGPVARPQLRRLPLPDPPGPLAVAAPLSYPAPAVGALYAFPPGTDGSGEGIGLIELGGGFTPAGIAAAFAALGLAAPEVTAVGIDGAQNQPGGSADGPDGEVQLDIEVAGALAPGARLTVYFAPNTDRGFHDAVAAAVHDDVHRPSVLSISWGGPEPSWTVAARTALDQALQDAALAGITVCVAAGDNGSGDGVADGLAHVDFPASSPHVLACGGTRLSAAGGAIAAEVVWNDQPTGGATGGGVSAAFPLPTWQRGAGVPASANPGRGTGRGLPDVAGDAAPETGYRVLVDGTPAVFGGTSAVAPVWAALIARCNERLGHPLGFLNPILYQTLAAQRVTRDVVSGGNGAYRAGPGWDPCTGWGSPIGSQLLAGLGG